MFPSLCKILSLTLLFSPILNPSPSVEVLVFVGTDSDVKCPSIEVVVPGLASPSYFSITFY